MNGNLDCGAQLNNLREIPNMMYQRKIKVYGFDSLSDRSQILGSNIKPTRFSG